MLLRAQLSLEPPDPQDVLLELWKAYEPQVDRDLWPWEAKRWHELVFCVLTVIDPDAPPQTLREVTRALADWHVLDIEHLTGLDPERRVGDLSHPTVVTMETLFQKCGLTHEQARTAVIAVCEAAGAFGKQYEAKVQRFFRKYGFLMVDEFVNFGFTSLSDEQARRACALWLQNTLNMPVPMSAPTVEQICAKLRVEYDAMVQAADASDINIALLDEALYSCSQYLSQEE